MRGVKTKSMSICTHHHTIIACYWERGEGEYKWSYDHLYPPPLPLVAHLYREGKTGYILTCNCPLTIVFNDYGGKGEYKWPYNYLYPPPTLFALQYIGDQNWSYSHLYPPYYIFLIKDRGGSTNGPMTICTPPLYSLYLHYYPQGTKTGPILTCTRPLTIICHEKQGGGSTNGLMTICTPPPLSRLFALQCPPCFFITNYRKRAGTSEHRSSFSLLWIGVQLKGVGVYK